MTYNVLMGTLNPTHSHTHSFTHSFIHSLTYKLTHSLLQTCHQHSSTTFWVILLTVKPQRKTISSLVEAYQWRSQGRTSWALEGPNPLKMCKRGWVCFDTPQKKTKKKTSQSLIQNVVGLLQVSHHQGWKTCVKNGRYGRPLLCLGTYVALISTF